jgi:uncharacterized transporter YbjL
MGKRTQAERDAMTVEIGYALFAATVPAGASYFAVTEVAPEFVGSLSEQQTRLNAVALPLTVIVFVVVVVTVLARFHRARQPSQPGRTNPDS